MKPVSSFNLFQLSCASSGYLHLAEGDQYLVVDKMSVSNTVPLWCEISMKMDIFGNVTDKTYYTQKMLEQCHYNIWHIQIAKCLTTYTDIFRYLQTFLIAYMFNFVYILIWHLHVSSIYSNTMDATSGAGTSYRTLTTEFTRRLLVEFVFLNL